MKARVAVCVMAFLVGCGDDHDDSPMGMGVDARAVDATDVSVPQEIAFAPVAYTLPETLRQFVRGPDGRIYGLGGGAFQVSSDDGVTFTELPGRQAESSIAASATSLFTSSPLHRTTDGTTFTALAVPGFDPTTMITWIAATSDELWAASEVVNTQTTTLYRSTDDGEHFTAIALPAGAPQARWQLFAGGPYLLAVLAGGHAYRTEDGESWDDLGVIPGFLYGSAVITTAGTAIAYATSTTYQQYRWPVGTTTPEITPVERLAQHAQRSNGELVRVAADGSMDVSTTDGVTWTPSGVAGLGQCVPALVNAVGTTLLGFCIEGTSQLRIRLAAGATAWTKAGVVGLPYPQFALYQDISFATDGTIVVAGKDRLFLTHDGGASWTVSSWHAENANIHAVAISPDGARILVGMNLGRYAFLDGTGTVQIESTIGPSAENIQQAQWMTDHLVLVTTASADDTQGTMWAGNPDRVGIWDEVNPARNESNPQLDSTAGFHGVAACPFAGDYQIAVSMFVWFGTNSYQNYFQVQYQHSDPYMRQDSPIGFAAADSISCAPNGTKSISFNDSNLDKIYLGNFTSWRETTLTGAAPGVITAKFAPDGRLWLVTGNGLFHSTDPVPPPF